MNTKVVIPAEVILKQIEWLMKFPYPTICRHLVAANLLSTLEEHGYPVSKELARAVVGADDDAALALLAERAQ
jgi:hypothetical protein